MKGNRAVLTAAVVAAALLAGWSLWSRAGGQPPVDLIARLGEAQKSPDPAAFTVVDAALAGETHRAVAVSPGPGSRIAWRITVPARAWLWLSIGMHPDAWRQEGDGIKFAAAVSDGGTVTPIFEQHLHPFANSGDRKWFPIRASLARYAGREVELILSTQPGPAGADDQRSDLALWGVPEIVVR